MAAPAPIITRKSLFSVADVLPHLSIVAIREGENVTHFDPVDANQTAQAASSLSSSSSASLPPSLPSLHPSSRVSSSYLCSTCAVAFDTAEELRDHARSPWHKYNIQQSSSHKPTLTEEQFSSLSSSQPAPPSSASSSPPSSDDDDDELESVMPKLSLSDDDDVTLAASPRISFSTPSQHILVWRSLLTHPADSSSLLFPARSSLYLHSFRSLPSLHSTAIFLSLGGRFSAAIFSLSTPTLHRSFQRYTVRAKQGGSQTSNDAANGPGHQAKSIGSSIRRKEAIRYMEELQRTLAEWKEELAGCQCIWLYAPGVNRRMFDRRVTKVEDDGGVREVEVGWDKSDRRVRGIPFSVYRPTFAEVRRVHKQLSTLEFIDRVEGEEDTIPLPVPQKLEEEEEEQKAEKEEEKEEADLLLLAIDAGDVQELHRLQASGYQRPVPREGMRGLVPPVFHAVRKGRVDLLSILTVPPFSFSVDEQCIDSSSLSSTICWSPLHFACASHQPSSVLSLLRLGADPTAKDSRGLTPYACAAGDEGKEVRGTMRRWAGGEGEGRWDYEKAGFRGEKPLTEEEEEEKRRREKEKDKAKKAKQKERQKQRKEEEKKAQAEAAEERKAKEAAAAVQRMKEEEARKAALAMEQAWQAREKAMEGMSEREKRALAAERRMAALKAGGAEAAKCDACAAPLVRTPFERLKYQYCSLNCLNKHREMLEKQVVK